MAHTKGLICHRQPSFPRYTHLFPLWKRVSRSFRVRFYRGDPADNLNEKGQPQTGSYGAGPIKPGDVWNEKTLPFALGEGVNEFYVILDTEDLVAETDETNNSALLKVLVKEGQISKATKHKNSHE